MEEQSLPESAAGNGEIGGFCFPHDFLDHQGTGDNDICPLGGKTGNLLPLLIALGTDGFHHGKEIFYREIIIVELRQGIGRGPLVHFRQVSDRTADTDDFHRFLGKPWDFRELLLDEFPDFVDFIVTDITGGLEHFCQGDSAHGDTDGVDPLFILYQGNFHAGPAQIKEKKILPVYGVDDAGKAQGRFCLSTDNGHGNAGGQPDPLEK